MTGLYLALGFAAIYVSDVLVVRAFDEPLVSRIQASKGIAEVLLTGGLIFGLTRGSRVPLELDNERLARQRQELAVLHRVLRHNIRNDLTAILGCAELIRDHADTQLAEWCETIRRRSNALLHSTEQASRINQISLTGSDSSSSTDLSTLVPQVVEANDHVTDDVVVTFDLPESARVETTRMLEVAIDQLLTNAVEHNDSRTPEISLAVESEPGIMAETHIRISDNGPGLPDHIEDVLDHGSEEPLLHMRGLGLWMVYWIVTESGGSMTIESGDDGTCVTLTVPSVVEAPADSMARAFRTAVQRTG